MSKNKRKDNTKIKVVESQSIFVKYSNQLNSFDLSSLNVIQKRFFMLFLAHMYKNQSVEFVFNEKEIRKQTNLGNYTKAAMNNLMTQCADVMFKLAFKYEYKNENQHTIVDLTHFAEKIQWDEDDRTLTVRLSESAINLVKGLEGGKFTSFELREYAALDQDLAQCLYVCMKQWRFRGFTQEIELEELRKLSGHLETRQDKFMEYIRNAVKKIEKQTAFSNVTLETIKRKTGQPAVIAIKIFFDKQQRIKEDQFSETTFISADDINNALESMWIYGIVGLNEDEKQRLIKIYGKEETTLTIERLSKYHGDNYKTIERLIEWLDELENSKKNINKYFVNEKSKSSLFLETEKSDLSKIFPGTYDGIPYTLMGMGNKEKEKQCYEDLKKFTNGLLSVKEFADKWNDGIYDISLGH